MTDQATYKSDGYLPLPSFMPREVATGFLARMKADLARQGVSMTHLERGGPLLATKAPELYGYHYPPMISFLWGMTPAIERIVGEELLPTYAYFRLYRAGDICRVHGDRQSCEHSISLTLACSDDLQWPLEIGRRAIDKPYARADETFVLEDDMQSVAMEAGDAVLYQGVHRHHGRTTPNPNRWSAHLFLHWVARGGPYADQAFDGQTPPEMRPRFRMRSMTRWCARIARWRSSFHSSSAPIRRRGGLARRRPRASPRCRTRGRCSAWTMHFRTTRCATLSVGCGGF